MPILIKCVDNAKQLILNGVVKTIRRLHIYGSTVIPSQKCPSCGDRAFVIDGRMSCCDVRVYGQVGDEFKIEVDKVGARRGYPPAWRQREILLEQANRCFYCGDEFGTYRTLSGKNRVVKLSWDHVVPFSFDGNNRDYVAACSVCNGIKNNLHFADIETAKAHCSLKIHEKKSTTETGLRELRDGVSAETGLV